MTLQIPPQYEGASAQAICAPGIKYGPTDFYHTNVQEAADYLRRHGNGRAVYGGQYASGTTWWTLDDKTISVTLDELNGEQD